MRKYLNELSNLFGDYNNPSLYVFFFLNKDRGLYYNSVSMWVSWEVWWIFIWLFLIYK